MYREITFRFGDKYPPPPQILITLANSGFKRLLEKSNFKTLDGKGQCYMHTFITHNSHRRPVL